MLEITGLGKTFVKNAHKEVVFEDFGLRVKDKQVLAIFGPNGSGKTTLLNIILGFTKLDRGQIFFGIEGTGVIRKQIGLILQDYRTSLLPWLTVADNIAMPLRIRGIPKHQYKKEVNKISRRFGFGANLQAYPYELSGGQQQFVAILRALVVNPKILLMDEPFSALDYDTSLNMQVMIANVLHQAKMTTIFVSHDIDSAILLSNEIAVLSNKPTRVVEIISNSLSYPRTTSQITTPTFIQLKKKVLNTYRKQLKLV